MATAVLQKPLTSNKGTWSAIFPNEQISEVQSSLFVKKLLAVAVSNIAYLRAIFPEQAFGDRSLEGLNLKILREDVSCPGTSHVIQWVKGCFDAFEKKYLRMLMLGLYTDPEKPETVIESYTFKFSYLDGGGLDIYRNSEKIASAHSDAETRKATIRLLRTLLVLTQTLDSLPDDIMMTMKLMYYDEVTPPDYEPPGFKAADSDTFYFEDEPMTIKVGDVSTAYHSLKVRVKTNKAQFEMKDKETVDETGDHHIEKEINTGLDEDITMESPKESDKNKKCSPSAEDSTRSEPDANADIPSKSPSKPESGADTVGSEASQATAAGDDFKVRCPCGCNEDDGLMVMCAECKFWQHGVCFLIMEEEDAPEQHICDVCAVKYGMEHTPTDPYLTELTPIQIQATCLWRRTLVACVDMNRVIAPDLAKRLGTEVTVAQGLLNRLAKEGYLKAQGRGKRLGKVIDKDNITKVGLPKYMKRHEACDKKSYLQNKVKSDHDQETQFDDSQADFQEMHKNAVKMLTEKTEKLQLSRKKNKLSKKNNQQDKTCKEFRRSPRLAADQETKPDKLQEEKDVKRKSRKRAVSKLHMEDEFEISSTQDVYDDPKCKKKASVVTKDIMV